MESLGGEYVVWDKAREIAFIAPGRRDVVAEFRVDDCMLEEIRAAAASGDKVLHWCETKIRDLSGDLVAKVRA